MEIVLNEITFTALLGSVILFTLTCANLVGKGRGGQQQDGPAAAAAAAGSGRADGPAASSAGNEDKAEEEKSKASVAAQSSLKYRRASSAPAPKKEHVVFADEALPEAHSPKQSTAGALAHEGILQNRGERALVRSASGEVEQLNAFYETRPLDDIEVIRKRSCTRRTSDVHASLILDTRSANKGENELEFEDVCKYLNAAEVAEEETRDLIDILNRKQEPGWLLTLSQKAANKDLESEAVTLRAKFDSHETESLSLVAKITDAEAELSTCRTCCDNLRREIAELTSKLDEERDENAALSKTLSEQQRLIRAAIDRISPPSSVDGVKICEEHQDFLDKYLRKLRGEKTDLEHKAAG